MKTGFKLSMIILIIIINAKYNNTLGQATQAVNAINPGDFLGTSNNNHIVFKAGTGGGEYMRIDYINGHTGIAL